jgi:serine protease Do
MGNPVGLAGGGAMCMSVGVVSAVGRELPKLSEREGRLYTNLIQTTAEVNPGNSGGPLFDIQGNVMGVVTAVVLPHKTTNGIGFAIPADAALRAKIEQLKLGTPIVYGYLGVAVRDHAGGGVWVTTVGDDAPASGVLQQGDVLVRVNGQPVSNESAFIRVVGAAPTDRMVTLVVNRSGREVSLNVRLSAHPDIVAGVDVSTQRLYWRGAELTTAASATGGGVRVAAIEPGSPLLTLGVKAGSIIHSIAGRPVPDLVTLQQILDETPSEKIKLSLIPLPDSAKTAVASTGTE